MIGVPLAIVAIILLLSGLGIVRVDDIDISGDVLISPEYAALSVGPECQNPGYELEIRPVGGESESVALRRGEKLGNGYCRYSFSTTVQKRDSYRFSIPTRSDIFPEKRTERTIIDTVGDDGETVLDVTLEW